MSVRLGILSDDQLDYLFVVSLMRLADARGITKAIFANGDVGRLDEGRNRVAGEFLKTDAEWLLWLDTDIVFTVQDFDKLLMRGKTNPIVSGLYFRASDPPTPCAMRYKDGRARVLETVPPGKVISVDTAGFGFMLTHREVLEKMLAQDFNPTHPWFDNGQIGPAGQTLADDASFCWRAKQLGYDIILDTDVRVGHIKPRPLYG